MSCEDTVCGTGGWVGALPGDPDNNSVLSATPAFGGIDVSWTYPVLNPAAVAHTLLYRGMTPSFTTALLRSVVAGNFFYDKTTYDLSIEYFYWIKIVSVNGTEGALIGPASAVARPTIDQTIELMSGKINEGVLAESLRTKIGGITDLRVGLGAETEARRVASAALAAALTSVQNDVTESMAFMANEVTARTHGDSALVDSFDLLAAASGKNTTAILEEATLRVSSVGAVANRVTTTEVSLNGNVATGQVGLTSEMTTVNGKVTGIGAQYTAKVSVNGLIGGFGVYNDGTEVQAGFDVDTFWVGKTVANKRKPFIIKDGETFIDQAVISTLTFDKLRAADGSVIVANGKLKANYVEAQSVAIKNAVGVVVLADGNGVFSGALSAASGTFSGTLSAASGTFSGTLSADNIVTTGNLKPRVSTNTALAKTSSGTRIDCPINRFDTTTPVVLTGKIWSNSNATNAQLYGSGGRTIFNVGFPMGSGDTFVWSDVSPLQNETYTLITDETSGMILSAVEYRR